MSTDRHEALRHPPQVGQLQWIGRALAPRAPLEELTQVELLVGAGLEGEHHAARRPDRRQVTLLQAEHLPVVARLCGREEVTPGQLRRNLVVAGLSVQLLGDRRFRIGTTVLEGTGDCPPCERMEENLGAGGYAAMLGHGGITARVLEGGVVRVGDRVGLA